MHDQRLAQKSPVKEPGILSADLLWILFKKNWILIGFIVFLGGCVVVGIRLLKPPTYVKGILISLPSYQENIIHADELRTIIRDLNGMIERDAKDILVAKGIYSEADVEDCVGIYCITAKDKEGIFALSIKSKREENIPNIARDTVNHLNNYPIISDRIQKQMDLLNHQIELFQTAVKNSEELKKTFMDLMKSKSPIDLSFNIVNVERSIREMKTELDHIQKRTELFKGFEIISNLDVPPNIEGFGFFKNISTAVLISFFIGIIIAFFRSRDLFVQDKGKYDKNSD